MNPFNWRNPQAAFQPPSDMQGGAGGSSTTKKVFVFLGIGCGIILIIIGILFAAGAFKAVTCCNQFKDVANSSIGAEQLGREFAQEVAEGKLDAAYARTSSEYQSTVTLEQFKAAVETHRRRMESSQPRPFNMQLEQHGDGQPSLDSMAKGTWSISYQFAGPADDTMLLLITRIGRQPGDDAEGFEVREVTFDERERNLAVEPPAAEVEKIHGMISRGQYEMAYIRFGDEFRQTSDSKAFREFVKTTSVGDVLRTTARLEYKNVTYNDANTQATVMAQGRNSDGQNVILQFELKPAAPELPGVGWRVVTIAEIMAESGDGETSPNGSTNNANGKTNQGTTNIAAGTNGAEPPTVEVTE